MFDSSKNISTRLADAADLLIDFATLGEYGLEPVAKASPKLRDPPPTASGHRADPIPPPAPHRGPLPPPSLNEARAAL